MRRSSSPPKPPRRKVKVTPQILEQCLLGTTDLTAEERSRYAFSDSYAALAADGNASQSASGAASKSDVMLDDMLEPDHSNKSDMMENASADQAETITYQRPDGAKLDVQTPLDGSSAHSDTNKTSTHLSDTLNSGQHDSLNDESKLLEESNAELTQSLMDLGLGGSRSEMSAPTGNGKSIEHAAAAKERKRESAAKLDAWIEREEDDGEEEEDGNNEVTYTKPDGQAVDLVMPLKTHDGSASHHTRSSRTTSHEMNDISTSFRGRLQQAAAADEDSTGYGGYGGPSPYDSSGHSGNWSTDHSMKSIDGEEDEDVVSIDNSAVDAAKTPKGSEESKAHTPPPPPDEADDSTAPPSRPAKDRDEAPVLLNDKHIYDVNQIGSLSTAGKKEDHARKVRSAKVVDALADLEGSVAEFGLEDRWAKREKAAAVGAVGAGAGVRESLTLESLASLDVPNHDRNNESSLAASGSVSGHGISSSSLNQPPSSTATTGLPPLSEEMSQNEGLNQTSSAGPTHVINLQELRRLSSQGIPEEGSHRALAWRILMGYLPPDTSQWEGVLKRDRGLYRNLVSELFVRPGHHEEEGDHLKSEGRRLQGSGVHKEGQSVRENGGANQASDAEGHNSIDMRGGDAVEESSKDLNGASIAEAAGKSRQMRRGSDIARAMMTKRSSMEEDTSGSQSGDEDTGHDSTSNSADKVMTPQSKSSDSAMPVHTPQMLVPARVREQWKDSGRDSEMLEAFSDATGHMNALLVIDDEGNTYDENGDKSPRKDGGRVHVNDDPLSLETGSKWAQFFENASLLDEIRKDVVRTHPDLTFFLEPEDNLGQRRHAAVERVLFVWAKLNKGVRYVQGMNEIVATLYFVLANDSNEEWACEAEADTYFLFNTLMVEMRDIFVPDLDHADTGIQGRISNMIALLSLHDPEVRCHLDDCGIDGSFYSIRWLTTLLSREFILPDS